MGFVLGPSFKLRPLGVWLGRLSRGVASRDMFGIPIIATLGGFTSGERFGCIQGTGCGRGPHFRPLPLLAVAYVAISGDWTSFLVQVSVSPLVGLNNTKITIGEV